MVYSIIVLLASILVSFYTGQLSCFIVPMTFYLLGQILIWCFSDNENKKVYSQLYGISFMAFLIYAIACYVFMREHGFSCLLVTDTITSYIPAVEDFMRLQSWKDGWRLLHGSYSSQAYSHAGIILFYWAAVGKFGMLFGDELYFILQVSVIFLSAYVPVFLYRFLVQNGISEPFKYSLIYAFFSVFFYYSTLILRDAPIALFYIISFSYLFSGKSFKKNIIFVAMIAMTFLIRPQNGFFLFLFYYISFFSNSERAKRSSLFILAIVGATIAYVTIRLNILEAMERNFVYAEENIAQETEGFINALDRLPPIVSEFFKMVYIHISPIPAWHYMGWHGINESNNLMSFPRMVAVAYNFMIIGGVFFGVIKYKHFGFSTKQTLLFLAALLYFFIQTSSTEQRRIMICYPVLLLFSIIVYQKVTEKQRVSLLQYSMILFLLVQFVAIIRGL